MSNVTPFSNKAVIKHEAGAWLIRIDKGDLSDSEIASFQAWLARGEFHRAYLKKLAKTWDSMAVMAQLSELFPLEISQEGTPHASPDKVAKKKRIFQHAHVTWAASAMLLVFVFTLLFVNYDIPAKPITYATKIGERADFTLLDGTVLTLNTNSIVEVDFSGDMRIVNLNKGEVNFDVAKNPNRPFVVYAGSGLVWAVGTRFNVRYTSQEVGVTVTEGVIKVFANVKSNKAAPPQLNTASQDTPEREAIVNAGQKVTYRQSITAPERVVEEQLQKSLAWQEGALVFQGETLEQAVLEIARYTSKEIVISDPSIKTMRVGGRYKTNDVTELLSAFSKGLGINVTEVTSNRIHITRDANGK